MGIWSDILNLILLATTLAAVLWGLRQKAVYRRVEDALSALREGKRPGPLRRGPSDSEMILQSFDRFVESYQPPAADDRTSPGESELGQVLARLCDALRPPLTAIQSYANSLEHANGRPGTTQQRESVQNLRLQVNGLLRLIESSGTLSELRQGLSGFQRQLAQPPVARESLSVLLVDDEDDWSRELAEATVEGGWKLLVAPGADAVRTMAASVQPLAVLVNAGRLDGLGWRGLIALKRNESTTSIPVVLYGLDGEKGMGRAWSPTDVWIWPPEISLEDFVQQWRSREPQARYSVHGESGLAQSIAKALREAGLAVQIDAAEPVVVLDHCCTLLILRDADKEEEVTELGQILIVEESKVESIADALAAEFNESRWLRWIESSRLRSDLMEKLHDFERSASPADVAP